MNEGCCLQVHAYSENLKMYKYSTDNVHSSYMLLVVWSSQNNVSIMHIIQKIISPHLKTQALQYKINKKTRVKTEYMLPSTNNTWYDTPEII